METKIQNLKSKGQKIQANQYHQMGFVEKVAVSANCSARMVRYVLSGYRNHETVMAQKILLAAAIIEERENALLNEVKRIVNF